MTTCPPPPCHAVVIIVVSTCSWLPYSGKFSRVLIFAVFAGQGETAKIVTSKITYHAHAHYYKIMRISPTAQLYDTFLHTRLDWTCEVGTSKMSLLKYFTKQKTTPLPDPSGALSREVPSSAIASANNEVQKITSSSTSSESKKRGPYSKSFSP